MTTITEKSNILRPRLALAVSIDPASGKLVHPVVGRWSSPAGTRQEGLATKHRGLVSSGAPPDPEVRARGLADRLDRCDRSSTE